MEFQVPVVETGQAEKIEGQTKEQKVGKANHTL